MTVTQAARNFEVSDELDVPHTITWADTERDLSAWLGNNMQTGSIDFAYSMAEDILASKDELLINDWRKLQTSDHFY